MKKGITFLLALMFIVSWAFADGIKPEHGPTVLIQQAEIGGRAVGDDCTDPIIVSIPADLPYSDLAQTNCGRGNSYDATPLGNYDGGEDIIYRLDVTADTFIDMTMDPGATTWTGLLLADNCPDVGASVAMNTGSSGVRAVTGVQLLAGYSYYVMVDTWPTPTCIPAFDLTIAVAAPPPANDTCATAEVTGEVTDLPFNTTTATASGFGTYITSNDLWYVFTAPGDGLLYVGLCDSSFDTKLALYDDCVPTTTLGTNDDSCGAQSELIDMPVVAGEDYYIQVGGYGTYSGAGLLDVAFTPSAAGPSYFMVEALDAGNPGGLNGDSDSSTTGWTAISNDAVSANEWSAVQPLPTDFVFEFYGQPVTEFMVSQNGIFTFNTTYPDLPPDVNVALPDATLPDMSIACFWDEFTPTPPTGSGDKVYMKEFGTAPNRQLWIKWQSFEYAGYSYAYIGMCLEETTNNVYIVDYNYHYGGPGAATVGLQCDATNAIQHSLSPNFVLLDGGSGNADNDYYQFVPLIPGAPGYPENPLPANHAVGVATTGDLTWDFGGDTETYDLWFGTAGSMVEVVSGATAGTTGTFAYEAMYGVGYQWQVVCHNTAVDMTTTGPVWDFTTMTDPSFVEVGTGVTTNQSLPMEPYYGYSWSNVIYLASEIGSALDITGLQYNSVSTNGFGPDEICIYLGHTTATEFASGDDWIDVNTMTLVYAGPFSVPAGGGWTAVTLQTPFSYNGTDNLVIGFDENTTGYHSSSDEFLCTDTTPVRGICYYNDSTNPDPFGTLPTANAVRNSYANVRLATSPIPVGSLSGYVYIGGTTTPIDGAEVTLGAVTAYTDATGFYEMLDVPIGGYEVSADYPGYLTTTHTVIINNGIASVQDFYLDYANMALDPTVINVVLQPGATDDQMITITNNGTADLTYSVSKNFYTADNTYEPDIRPGAPANPIYNDVNVTNDKQIEYDSDALFDLQFAYPCAIASGEAGIETDGMFIYVPLWNGTDYLRYDMDGAYIEMFSVAGTSGVRDLAYDGQYFYGAAADVNLYQMDFTQGAETLVSTITAPVACRAIAYDPVNMGFWANNWSTDITLFDMTGTILNSFPVGTALSYYGFAYDQYSAGGPYLWGFSQNPANTLVQFDLATGLETGVNFNVGALLGTTGSAGGLCISDAFVPGYATLCGIVQNETIFGLELTCNESWLSITDPGPGIVGPGGTADVMIQFDATGYNTGDFESGGILFTNNGITGDQEVPVSMTVGDGPQTPAVIFSEYIEGSSNNKALEIWNNTGATINLDDFRIAQSVNGGGWAYWHIFPTGATVVDQDVWVMLNADTDPLLFDPANADEILTYPSVVHHNGDDARGLEWTPDGGTTWLLIDVIGIPTEDPGTGWDVAGVTEATANHTLYRKDAIMSGNTDWLVSAGTDPTDSEWIVYDQNTFEYLGQHPAANPFAPPSNVMVDDFSALVTWDAPPVVISQDCFDTYTPGDFLGVVNPGMWTTWSNLPGSSEDVVVSNTQAASPDNSILVQTNNDCVMIINDYTSGVYSLEMDVFVPTGFGGYFNLQKTSTPGTEWAFQIYFNDDGTAVADAGAASALTYTYAHDTWMNMRLVVDLNTDWCDFYVDDVLMIGYQWSLGTFGTAGLLQFGGMNIFGGGCTGTPMFYFDNVVLTELVPATDALTGYNVYLDGALQGTTADLFYQLDTATLVSGNAYTAGVSAVYDDPGESVIVEDIFTYAPGVAGDTCGDAIVVGEVTDLPFDTTTATASGFGTYITSQDLFYAFTAPSDGLLYVGLCDSGFDTKLALYGACDPATEIATNDDACGGSLQSELIDIPVVGGEDYFIQVGGYGTAAGAGFLDVAFTSSTVFDPPTNLYVDDMGYATWDAPGGGTNPIGLYSQWDFPSAEGAITAQDFEAAYDVYDAEGADEFVVPTGETWTIAEVAVLGSYSAAGPCDLANVRFYADNAGMPGTLLFEYLDVVANPDVDGNLDCFIPDTQFTAGTYWLSVQGRQDFATAGQWYWGRQAAPTIGSEFYWQNPGNGFGSGFTTWTAGSNQWPGQFDYNLSFALFGTQTDANGKTYVRSNPNPNNFDTVAKTTKKAMVNFNTDRTPTIDFKAAFNSTDILTGYNVYLDGAFVAFTTDLFYEYTGLTGNTTYLAEVTAVYDDPGESDPDDYLFTYQPGPLPDPPTNLYVDNMGYATWDAPGGGGANLFWNDFESDDGGLLSNNAAGWQWGAATTGPNAGYSGTNVWATVLAGNYPTNSNFTLDTPTSYSIASADAMLSFWHWYDIEASYDGGNVKISTDGGTSWNVITPLTGYTGTANTSNPLSGEPVFCGHVQGFWELAEFDLSSYVGQDVMFRWHFGSDSSVQYVGWYIDDVLLTGGGGGGGSGTVQVDPMAVDYWTGTTDGATLTQTSLVNAMEYEDGWMMFDVSGIPDGSTITEIEFNGYVNATYYPYWDINAVYVDPLTAAPADLLAAITNSANGYNQYMESSTFAPGWKVDVLGGNANADLAAALANDWFCLGIDSTDDYITYFITFDGWNEANPPFLMVTYEGTDGKVARTKVSGASDKKADATDDTRNLLGYNVYLDGNPTPVAFTTDTFYQYTGLTIGQSYLAEVTAVYDEGESTPIDYTFIYDPTSPAISVSPMSIEETLDPNDIMQVPLTITNTGSGELTFDITVELELTDGTKITKPVKYSRVTNPSFDVSHSEAASRRKDAGASTDVLWDILLQFDVDTPTGQVGLAGMEWDGTYFYATKWSGSNQLFQFDAAGNYIAPITVPLTGCRDVAHDGTYFYGSPASASVTCWEPTTGTAVPANNISVAGALVRAIAYDEVTDTFWSGNWSDNIVNWNRSGTIIGTNAWAGSLYGLAYDNDPAGPYLYAHSQDTGCVAYRLDPNNALAQIDMMDFTGMGGTGAIAGGACAMTDWDPAYRTLGLLLQGTPDYIAVVEIGVGDEPWLSVDTTTGSVFNGAPVTVMVTLDATDLIGVVKQGQVVIANNAGADVEVPVTMTVTQPGGFDPPQNVMVDDETGLVTWTPPAAIIDEDNFDSYTPGDYLGVVNPTLWTTWSNAPGGPEDVVVSDVQSNSPNNSILVELNNDCVMIMDDYTSGVYSMDIDMYVPTGYCGYFNMQKTSVPGTEWAFQIYFLTDGTTIIDAGAASAATFNYFHDEWMDLRLVIDLDTDWAEFFYNGTSIIGYQWTLGTFGTAGLLQLGGMNIFGGANSGTTDTPMFYVDNMEFKDLSANADPLTGYNVYLDGIFQGYTTNESYQLIDLVNGQSYVAGVSAVYDDPGESIIVEYPFTYGIPPVLPPNNLEAAVEDYNNVLLTWELPGGASEEILYHSGYDNNGIGTNGVVDFICCARFTAAELADYYGGWSISAVNIFLHSMDFSYVGIKVYEGGSVGNPGTVVYDQDITSSAVALDWTPHLLTTPIPLVAGNEYWIGYDLSATADHPAAVDMGPMVPDKGGWLYYSGAWDTLAGLGLDYNWVITGIVSQGDEVASIGHKKNAVLGSSKVQSRILTAQIDAPFEAEFKHKVRQIATQQTSSRSLAGYKVYRDGGEIAEINDPAELEYLDEGLDAGTYEYYVTALYENPDDESGPSNLVDAVITLPAPTGLAATSNWPNILCTWTAMPGVQGYNLYQDDDFVVNTTSTFYLHANQPEGTYTYNVAAVFNGGYEGAWSADVIVVHTGAGGILVPLVTSLDGNYPNPFNPTTMIKFGLHEDSKVAINVYNIKGEKVRTLVNGELEAGYHDILWNGKDDNGKTTASGVYFYKMKAGKFVSTKKMILMK